MKNTRAIAGPYPPFGKSGLSVPPIVYGTSYLGNLYREMEPEVKQEIMEQWFRSEISLPMIDSAGKYGAGLALEVIGNGLRKMGVDNDRILISNKLGWYRVPLEGAEPTFEPGAWAGLQHDAVQRISYQGILDCWEQGCELLGGSYRPQLVSVHDPDEYLAIAGSESERGQLLQDILEAYRALFELKEKGVVKAVGIGAKDWRVIEALYERVPFDWVMFANKMTLFHHPPEIVHFIERLGRDGVGIINSAIFNAGFLTGGAYFDYRRIDPDLPADQELLNWRQRFFNSCERHRLQPGDVCLQFALMMPQIHAVALNPGKPSRFERNAKILSDPLPDQFWKELKAEGIIGAHFDYIP